MVLLIYNEWMFKYNQASKFSNQVFSSHFIEEQHGFRLYLCLKHENRRTLESFQPAPMVAQVNMIIFKYTV